MKKNITITLELHEDSDEGIRWCDAIEALQAVAHGIKRDAVDDAEVYKPIIGGWSGTVRNVRTGGTTTTWTLEAPPVP